MIGICDGWVLLSSVSVGALVDSSEDGASDTDDAGATGKRDGDMIGICDGWVLLSSVSVGALVDSSEDGASDTDDGASVIDTRVGVRVVISVADDGNDGLGEYVVDDDEDG